MQKPIEFRTLLSPVRLGSVEVKNRVALAPMGVAGIATKDGSPSEYCMSFMRERARGGVGLIITANTAVEESQRTTTMGLYHPRMVPGYTRLTETVHRYGAKIFLQLAHQGGIAESSVTGRPPVAPSAIACRLYPEVPRELALPEVQSLVERFVQAAAWAKRAHFDGVELHAAHGHDLIEQFISPHLNRREDAYGGDFEGRMRFVSEILCGIKDVCGDSFPVGIKLSAYEHLEQGIRLPLAKQIAEYLVERGIDYLHIASAVFGLGGHAYLSVGPMYADREEVLALGKAVKAHVGDVPVIGAANVHTPEFAERSLVEGNLQMLALGRALIADPEWVTKTQQQREEDIRVCIRCNECHLQMARGEMWKCTVNPFLSPSGDQEDVRPARKRARVVVIGAGPAGMQAAAMAARRGHDVDLIERGERLGGNMVAGSLPPFKEDVRHLLLQLERELQASPVRVRLEEEVPPDRLADVLPSDLDHLVLATGADYIIPGIPGLREAVESGQAITGTQALMAGEALGDEVVVLGAGMVGCEVAWYLASMGKQVRIVERLPQEMLLAGEHPNNRAVTLWNLKRLGVPILMDREVTGVRQGELCLRDAEGRTQALNLGILVLAAGFAPRRTLWDAALRRLPPHRVLMVGDCASPGKLRDALHRATWIPELM